MFEKHLEPTKMLNYKDPEIQKLIQNRNWLSLGSDISVEVAVGVVCNPETHPNLRAVLYLTVDVNARVKLYGVGCSWSGLTAVGLQVEYGLLVAGEAVRAATGAATARI